MSKQNDTPSTPTNAYIEIIDFDGPPTNGYGRIHVQIAVWADKDMTDLIDVADCHSLTTMNSYLRAVMDKYSITEAVQ